METADPVEARWRRLLVWVRARDARLTQIHVRPPLTPVRALELGQAVTGNPHVTSIELNISILRWHATANTNNNTAASTSSSSSVSFLTPLLDYLATAPSLRSVGLDGWNTATRHDLGVQPSMVHSFASAIASNPHITSIHWVKLPMLLSSSSSNRCTPNMLCRCGGTGCSDPPPSSLQKYNNGSRNNNATPCVAVLTGLYVIHQPASTAPASISNLESFLSNQFPRSTSAATAVPMETVYEPPTHLQQQPQPSLGSSRPLRRHLSRLTIRGCNFFTECQEHQIAVAIGASVACGDLESLSIQCKHQSALTERVLRQIAAARGSSSSLSSKRQTTTTTTTTTVGLRELILDSQFNELTMSHVIALAQALRLYGSTTTTATPTSSSLQSLSLWYYDFTNVELFQPIVSALSALSSLRLLSLKKCRFGPESSVLLTGILAQLSLTELRLSDENWFAYPYRGYGHRFCICSHAMCENERVTNATHLGTGALPGQRHTCKARNEKTRRQ